MLFALESCYVNYLFESLISDFFFNTIVTLFPEERKLRENSKTEIKVSFFFDLPNQ